MIVNLLNMVDSNLFKAAGSPYCLPGEGPNRVGFNAKALISHR